MAEDSKAGSTTSQAGSGSSGGVASTVAGTAGGGAGTGTFVDQASARDRNSQSFAGATTSQDVGTDERFSVANADSRDLYQWNQKRTGDQFQSADYDELIDRKRNRARLDNYSDRAAEQTLLHQAKLNSIEIAERERRIANQDFEAEQRRRHYEDMHTMRFNTGSGFWADSVQEAFAERVAGKVCARMKA